MKRLILPAMAFGLFFGCEQTPEQAPVTTYSIEQFYKNINVSGGSFSPDESKMLVSTNETGIYNAYEIPVDGKGEKKQLTNSTVDSYFALSYFPNDERVLFTADQGGNENNHIYLQTPDGTQKDLTPYDSAKSSFYGWSQDMQSMFIASNKRDAKFMDVYERTIESLDGETGFGEVIYQNNDGRDVAAISPDKNYFALTESITSADSKMYLYNKATGETSDISEHEGDVQYNPQF
ncbi:MAG: S9 family peptidase, partial [Imperialibacter sp.]